MKPETKPVGKLLLPALIVISLCFGSCGRSPKIVQPQLGARSVKILELDSYQFKDLNRNGKLDKYEDWRLSPNIRSLDLLSQMSVEEKAGFMLINSLNMVGTRAAEASDGKLSASDLSEGGGGGFGGGGGAGRGGFSQERPQNPAGQPGQGVRSGARGGTRAGTRPGGQDTEGGFVANMNRGGGTKTGEPST